LASITIERTDLLDALLDLRGVIGDGGVRLRVDAGGISLVVPDSSDLSRRLVADVDGAGTVVDTTIRRRHLAIAVSSLDPGASAAEDRVRLEVHDDGTVLVQSAGDPRIVHRLAVLGE
jgi:hypothetical protein